MYRSLSIPAWHQMAKTGTNVPVRIPLMGYSMFPLIRYNRDMVTVMHAEGIPQIGDIVLFPDHNRNLYVMHRVWDVKDQMVLTWGDNCAGPDFWIPVQEIWGKAVLIERGSRIIYPDLKKGMRWARFWHKAGKVYRFCKRIKNGLARRIHKLKREVPGEDRI